MPLFLFYNVLFPNTISHYSDSKSQWKEIWLTQKSEVTTKKVNIKAQGASERTERKTFEQENFPNSDVPELV